MPNAVDTTDALPTIRTDLGAIFISSELSRSKWLITSFSPGAAEKMSKHMLPGGDLDVRDAIARPHPLATAEFSSLRMRLLKIAGRITETASSVRIAVGFQPVGP